MNGDSPIQFKVDLSAATAFQQSLDVGGCDFVSVAGKVSFARDSILYAIITDAPGE